MTFTGSQSATTVLALRRQFLAAAQQAWLSGHHESRFLRATVTEFVLAARRGGLSLEWVLTATQDVVDACAGRRLDESRRRALGSALRCLAQDAFLRQDAPAGRRSESVTASLSL